MRRKVSLTASLLPKNSLSRNCLSTKKQKLNSFQKWQSKKSTFFLPFYSGIAHQKASTYIAHRVFRYFTAYFHAHLESCLTQSITGSDWLKDGCPEELKSYNLWRRALILAAVYALRCNTMLKLNVTVHLPYVASESWSEWGSFFMATFLLVVGKLRSPLFVFLAWR